MQMAGDTHISKLHNAQLSQLTDAVVGCTRLQEKLHEAHLLTAEHGAHDLEDRENKHTLPFRHSTVT